MARPEQRVDDMFLVRARLAPSTLEKYARATLDFIHFCEEKKLETEDDDSMDVALRLYIHWMFREGRSRQAAADAVHGLQAFAGKKLPLMSAKASLAGWKRVQPSEPWPPMLYELALLCAFWLGKNGRRAEGAAMLVSFHCLLRIGELLGAKVGDVAGPRDARLGSSAKGWTVALPRTKTGKHQWVVVHDDLVAGLLSSWTRGRGRSESLFELSAHRFRKGMKDACQALGLGDIGYVPHSLRHGGATYLRAKGWSLPDIQQRGRWKVGESAAHYIQQGRALLLAQSVPPEAVELGGRLAGPAGQALLASRLAR